MQLTSAKEPLSVNTKASTSLLEIFVVAIILAFLVTVASGTLEMQVLAVALVTPIAIVSLALIHYCKKGKVWSYAGAAISGVLGVMLRVVVST